MQHQNANTVYKELKLDIAIIIMFIITIYYLTYKYTFLFNLITSFVQYCQWFSRTFAFLKFFYIWISLVN